MLGGSGEAVSLAHALEARVDIRLITSLRGVTRNAEPLPGELVVGGFGGVEGLRALLAARGVEAVVDATHPFARRIAWNVWQAATAAGLPRLKIWRAPWAPEPGDRWLDVADVAAARRLTAASWRRPFVSLGRSAMASFPSDGFDRVLYRSIEPAGDPTSELPANTVWVQGRGPFDVAGELSLFREHGIDVVVTKNSGGEATVAKLAAARQLGLPVVMIRRPPDPPPPLVATVDAALDWFDQRLPNTQRDDNV